MARDLRASQNVAANLRRIRQGRGISLAILSELLAEHGHPLTLPVLSKIELGQRRMEVDDLAAFSAVLDVPTSALLAPPELRVQDDIIDLVEEWIAAELAVEDARAAAAEAFGLLSSVFTDPGVNAELRATYREVIEQMVAERMKRRASHLSALEDVLAKLPAEED